MTNHQRSKTDLRQSGSFWRSRAGATLIVFLSAAGLLLGYEHRVHIFTGNGFLIVLLLLCVGMHLVMHNGHGRHSGDSGEKNDQRRDSP